MDTLSALLVLCEGNPPCGALMFSLVLVWTYCWTNSRIVCDLKSSDVHVMKQKCSHTSIKKTFTDPSRWFQFQLTMTICTDINNANRQQTSIWTTDQTVHWRTNVSSGPNVVTSAIVHLCVLYLSHDKYITIYQIIWNNIHISTWGTSFLGPSGSHDIFHHGGIRKWPKHFWFCHPNTVECRYNAAQYSKILHTSLQWRR